MQSSDLVRTSPHFQVETLHESGLMEFFMYSKGLRASFGSIYLSKWVSRWPEGSNQTILGLLGLHGICGGFTPD